jgi:carbonic anhydrase/acetyltransferase-like protein (isoleucine patch superfamily)
MRVFTPIAMLRSFKGKLPRVAPSAYVDPGATVIGDVTVGSRSSVWPGAVLRGDNDPIRLGEATNIQDGAVIHTDPGFPVNVGDRVTVGHAVVLHGCTVEDDGVVGIGAIVLNGARIGKGAVVAAGALVPEGMEVAADTLVMGTPAKPRRAVSPEEQERFRKGAESYARRAEVYLKEAESR